MFGFGQSYTGGYYVDVLYGGGTSADRAFRVMHGSTEQFRVQADNKVGIGTTSPGSTLSIVGGIGIGTTDSFANAVIAANNLAVQGNVGIGTTNPTNLIDIYSGSTQLAYIKANGSNGLITSIANTAGDPTSGISSGAVFGFNGSGTNFYGIGLGAARNSKYDIWFQTGATNGGGYRWYIGTAEKMTMDSTGNVGIGITNPSYKLDVNGSVRIASGFDLYIGSVGLGSTLSPTSSGAYLIGANDEFDYSSSTNVQGVLNDIDAAIAGVGGSNYWTLNSNELYPDSTSYNVGIGATYVGTAKLYVNGNVGIGTTTPTGPLTVEGTGNVTFNQSGYVDFSYKGVKRLYQDVITVNANGGADYTTISDALAAASSGDAVYIYPGTYTGNITIPDGVAIIGADRISTIIQAPSGSRGPTITLNGNNRISNLTVNGNGSAWTYTLIGFASSAAGATIDTVNLSMACGDATNHYVIDTRNWTTGYFLLNNSLIRSQQYGTSGGTSNIIYGFYADTKATTGSIEIKNNQIPLNAYDGTLVSFYNSYAGYSWNNGKGLYSNNISIANTVGNANSYTVYSAVLSLYSLDNIVYGKTYNVVREEEFFIRGSTNVSDNTIFQSSAIGNIELILKAYSGQTANLFQWQNSSGTPLGGIDASGNLGIGTTSPLSALDIRTGNLGVGTTMAAAYKIDVNGDVRVVVGSDYYVGVIGLNDNTTSSSGSSLVGLFDDTMTYITANTTVQTAIKQLDTAIAGVGTSGGYWTLTGSNLCPDSTSYAVGIGITLPTTKLQIDDTNKAIASRGNLFITTSDAVAIDKGGQISFGGLWSTGSAASPFAAIAGRKENATDGNAAGYLQLSTASSAGGVLAERIRINSLGNVGIGTTLPKNKTDIIGSLGVGTTEWLVSAPSNGVLIQGNVGIGTTIPNAMLEVSGDVNIGSSNPVTLTKSAAKTFDINMTNEGSAGHAFRIGLVGWSTDYFAIENVSHSATYHKLTANGDSYLSAVGGNLGVGTTSPTQKLDVSGGIIGTGVTVTNLAGGGMVKSTGGLLGIATSTSDYEVPLTFTNGLTRTLNDIHLGGTLQNATDIALGGFNFTYSGTGNVGIGVTMVPAYKLDVGGDLRVGSGYDYHVGTIGLSDNSTSSSGSTLVGLYDDTMTYISSNTNVQSAIKQLDTAIAGVGTSGGYWTLNGSELYPDSTS